jgi:hypothetical protein
MALARIPSLAPRGKASGGAHRTHLVSRAILSWRSPPCQPSLKNPVLNAVAVDQAAPRVKCLSKTYWTRFLRARKLLTSHRRSVSPGRRYIE